MRLVKRVEESAIITSFHVVAEDGLPLWPFRAGQYLPIQPPIDGKSVARTYTISSDPADLSHYRLSIKREPAPPGTDLPPGAVSNWMHDQFQPGMTLTAHPPRGDFVLSDSTRPLVLLSGGVGITPMISYLAELAATPASRRVWFLHACRDGGVQAFGAEAARLAARQGATELRVFHEAPRSADKRAQNYDVFGRITTDSLRSILPFDDYNFHLCGPAGFMAALYQGLTALNVQPDRIAYEFFGPATVLGAAVSRMSSAPLPMLVADGPAVTFAASGLVTAWTGQHASLLELAESLGLSPEHSCRDGICGTCRVRLLTGKVRYARPPIAQIDEGEVLICSATPQVPITLDL